MVEKRQHEDFDHTNYHHDIAILKLHRPATFNTYVWPICLPPVGLSAVNQTAVIIGKIVLDRGSNVVILNFHGKTEAKRLHFHLILISYVLIVCDSIL